MSASWKFVEARPAFDPAAATDLRRRRRRELVQTLVERAEAAELPADERALLRAAFVDGRSAIEIAALAQEDVRAVRRRIRRVAHRILSPMFVFVLRHRDAWPTSRKRVATICVLQGLSLRDAALRLQCSLYTVRRQHDAIRALFESVSLGAGVSAPAIGPAIGPALGTAIAPGLAAAARGAAHGLAAGSAAAATPTIAIAAPMTLAADRRSA